MRSLRRPAFGRFPPIAAKRGIVASHPLDLAHPDARVIALEQSRLIERSIELPFKETARATGPFRCSGGHCRLMHPRGCRTRQLPGSPSLRASRRDAIHPNAAKRGISPLHPIDAAVSDSRVIALEQDRLIERSIRSVQTETARETGPFRCSELWNRRRFSSNAPIPPARRLRGPRSARRTTVFE
jgi:hypothetical protein